MPQDHVAVAIDTYGTKRENLLPVLQYVAGKEKWLTEDALTKIAQSFRLPTAEVYSVASFYSLLETTPRGKYVIRVCRTISCSMSGKWAVLEALKKTLDLEIGETSTDQKFSLLETNCMGWCAEGPCMLVNDTVHAHLTPEKVVEIIQDYRSK
jgi:NADH-quinone oxidoreductase subunit E